MDGCLVKDGGILFFVLDLELGWVLNVSGLVGGGLVICLNLIGCVLD